jgi:hypothetical protein
MPPVYDPDKVAQVILNCALHPKREVISGAAGKAFVLSNRLAGGVMEIIGVLLLHRQDLFHHAPGVVGPWVPRYSIIAFARPSGSRLAACRMA